MGEGDPLMCDSCAPKASKPLRVSTNGCERGRVQLLIDSDEHGTVIDVEVDVDELIKLMQSKMLAKALESSTWHDWIIPETR